MTKDETGRDNREGGGAYSHSRILHAPVGGSNKALTVHRIVAPNDRPMTLTSSKTAAECRTCRAASSDISGLAASRGSCASRPVISASLNLVTLRSGIQTGAQPIRRSLRRDLEAASGRDRRFDHAAKTID